MSVVGLAACASLESTLPRPSHPYPVSAISPSSPQGGAIQQERNSDPVVAQGTEQAVPQTPLAQDGYAIRGNAEVATAPRNLQPNLGEAANVAEEDSVTFRNGIRFHFPSSGTKAHFGTLIQQDWVFFDQDSDLEAVPSIGDLENGTFFRRARVKFDGTTYGFIEWDFDAELLASSNVVFDDLWVGFKEIEGIGNIRVGHVKLPQGLESITSNRVFTFLERSAQHDAFYNEYGPGVLVFDNYAGNRGQWSFSVHRQDPAGDGVSIGDGEIAGTGRLTGIPYAANNDEQLVHLGLSASYRAALDGEVRFRARPELRIARDTPRFVDTGPILADDALVLGSEVAVVHGPLSMQAEYTVASALGREAATPGGSDDDPVFHGGFVQLSYFLTGEHRPYDRRLARMGNLSPRKDVSFDDRLAGAWELAARGTLVDLNDGDIRGGQLDAWTFGVNWYLNPFFRTQLNYVLTNRDAPDGEGTAHAILMRFSLNL